MDIKEAAESINELAEVFGNISTARRMLLSKPLDQALFDELNGDDRGLESLIGHDVFIDFDNAGEVASLKAEIFNRFEATEIEIGTKIKAALECYCEDLVNMVAKYDAYSTQNADIRSKLVEKLKTLTTNEAKKNLLAMKMDCECFSYTQCIEILKLMENLIDFFGTDTFNLRRLEDLSKKNGIDLIEEEKEFLGTLQKVVRSDLQEPGWKKINVLWGDRIQNATLETLGFDSKKLQEICKDLTQMENKFYKLIRNIRETLCHETDTTDSVAVKNTMFYNAVNNVIWYAQDISGLCTALSEQLSLTLKGVETLAVTQPKPQEDNPQPEPPVEGNQDNVEPPSPENNADDNTPKE